MIKLKMTGTFTQSSNNSHDNPIVLKGNEITLHIKEYTKHIQIFSVNLLIRYIIMYGSMYLIVDVNKVSKYSHLKTSLRKNM